MISIFMVSNTLPLNSHSINPNMVTHVTHVPRSPGELVLIMRLSGAVLRCLALGSYAMTFPS